MNDLEMLGRKVAGSEPQARQLVQRALAVLGFRVTHDSWGMYIETVDGKRGVFFAGMPAFSSSWSSILGKLVAIREIGVETTKEEWPSDIEEDRGSADSSFKWTSNPFFGCKSKEEVEIKLDLLGSLICLAN